MSPSSAKIALMLLAVTGAVGVLAAPKAKQKHVDVDATADLDAADTKAVSPASRVLEGVLDMLAVAQKGDVDDTENAIVSSTEVADGGEGKGPGERGIHKKKFLYHQLWSVFSWWAWTFAVVAIKFKVVLLVLWGHLTYFIIALIRMLIRELKRDHGPVYGPPPPPPPQYGPQYGPQYAQPQYAPSSYASSPYKRRTGSPADGAVAVQAQGVANSHSASSAHDLAYGAHAR